MGENSANFSPPIAGDDLDMSVRERALSDAKISKIYDYWLKKCDGDALPTRHAIDPVDVYDCLSMLMILEVVDGGRDFRIRLAGSVVEEAHDRTLKGVMVSDLVICPLQSGPKVNLDWTLKEKRNGQETRA